MKTIRQSSQRFLSLAPFVCLLGAVLLSGAQMAKARGISARGAAAFATGWGLGYSGYGYSSAVSTGSTGGHNYSSLPSGYVSKLPSDAAPVVVFGKTYYYSSGNYYSPVFYGGCTYYAPANP